MVIIKKIDDKYFMVIDDGDAVEIEVKQPKGWEETLYLPENPTGRTLMSKKTADRRLAETGEFELSQKPVRVSTGGTVSNRIPNKKLIEYLSEEEKAEYLAIIDRAREAMMADRKKPMTEREKLEAKIKKAQEALALLEQQATGDVPVEQIKKSKKNKKEAE